VQLLQKLSIRATNGPDKLMKVIKQPVTMHLPAGCTRVGFSRSAPEVIALPTFVADLPDDSHTLFVVRAAHQPCPSPLHPYLHPTQPRRSAMGRSLHSCPSSFSAPTDGARPTVGRWAHSHTAK
jgi:hypothetical protein